MAFFDDIASAMRRQAAPVTVGICAAIVVLTTLFIFTGPEAANHLAFGPDWLGQPWTILTYPFVFLVNGSALAIIFLIFTILWLVWVGGDIEREQKTLRYSVIWVAFTVLPAISMMIGWRVVGAGAPLSGPWLPISALTVIWGFRHRTSSVTLFGVIPMNGFWIALLSVVTVFVVYAQPTPLLGVFACLPLLLAYAFATDRIPVLAYAVAKAPYRPSKAQQLKEQRFYDEVRKREKDREERDKLRKLFESSFDDEPKG